jgi:glycosyltransferase involved in cell wall biosynthesis
MKILHLSHGDSIGGAARFTLRTHSSLLDAGIESQMWVSSKKSVDPRIFLLGESREKQLTKFRAKAAQQTDSLICNLERTRVRKHKSPGWVGALGSNVINDSNSDIVHAHWINGGLISIRQLGRIKKPLVWSMLDFWPVMGAEHYSDTGQNSRWVQGFDKAPRDSMDFGVDICGISAGLKRRYWGQIHAVVPGKWMLNQVQKSSLLPSLSPIVVPPALDTKTYFPVEKKLARSELGISPEVFIIGYGGGTSGRKGWDIFQQIVSHKFTSNLDIEFIVFGSDFLTKEIQSENPIRQLGKIKVEDDLRLAYSSMDILVMPSKMDTFGLIAQEAQSCGVPVICFEDTGVADVIANQSSGLAVKREDVGAMLQALEGLINSPEKLRNMSKSARMRATENWSYDIVSRKYIELYTNVLALHKESNNSE